MSSYRERIYEGYASSRGIPLAPRNPEGFKGRAPLIRKLIRAHFPAERGAQILDLGCGHGVLLHFAREAGYTSCRGVDRSPEQVAEAHRLGIPDVAHGDALGTLKGVAGGSLDLVVSFDVVEHLTKPELFQVADEVRRVLRPGGQWILHTPNGESPFGGRVRYGDFTHELSFTRSSLAQLLGCAGFTRIQSFEDAPIPHGLVSLVRFLLWKIVRLLLRAFLAIETGETGKDAILTQNFTTVACVK